MPFSFSFTTHTVFLAVCIVPSFSWGVLMRSRDSLYFNKLRTLVLSVAILPLLLACQSKYYQTEQKRTELPIHQMMEKADKTIWREIARLDAYCQEVIDAHTLALKPSTETAATYQYRDHICYQQREWYAPNKRSDEFKRERYLSLLSSRVPITLERSAEQQRDLKSPQDFLYEQQLTQADASNDNPILNRLYAKDSRVDTMLYEWFRVNQALSVIEEIKTCLEQRDVSRLLATDMAQAGMLSPEPLSAGSCDELWNTTQVSQ